MLGLVVSFRVHTDLFPPFVTMWQMAQNRLSGTSFPLSQVTLSFSPQALSAFLSLISGP